MVDTNVEFKGGYSAEDQEQAQKILQDLTDEAIKKKKLKKELSTTIRGE